MMHKAWSSTEEVPCCFSRSSVKFQGHTGQKNHWCSIEEVPYHFLRSSIKFQGHTGWKIDNLNPIWERLIGLSQLSNPSDLPCLWMLASAIWYQGKRSQGWGMKQWHLTCYLMAGMSVNIIIITYISVIFCHCIYLFEQYPNAAIASCAEDRIYQEK